MSDSSVCLEEVEMLPAGGRQSTSAAKLCFSPKGSESDLQSLLLQGLSTPTQPCQPALPWKTLSWAAGGGHPGFCAVA